MKIKILLAVAALFIIGSSAAQAELKLKIGTLPIADTLLLHVAQREGFFKAEGLEVELIPFQGFIEKNAAVQSGELDGHFCDISSVIIQRAANLPFVVVATTSHTNPKARMFGLVTSPKCGATTIDELSGRSLATSRLAIVDFLADIFLESEGLPPDFMPRKNLAKIPVRTQMLLAGQVDAAVLPEPLLSIIEKAGGRVILDDRALNMPLAAVALREDLATVENVIALRKALTKAGQAINDQPEHYRPLLVELRLIPPHLADSFIMPPTDLELIPNRLPSPELYQVYIHWLTKNKVFDNGSTGGSPSPPPYEEVIWQAPNDETRP